MIVNVLRQVHLRFDRITTSKQKEEPQGTIKPFIGTSHNHVPQERVGFISV